jgi:hypothetical protein
MEIIEVLPARITSQAPTIHTLTYPVSIHVASIDPVALPPPQGANPPGRHDGRFNDLTTRLPGVRPCVTVAASGTAPTMPRHLRAAAQMACPWTCRLDASTSATAAPTASLPRRDGLTCAFHCRCRRHKHAGLRAPLPPHMGWMLGRASVGPDSTTKVETAFGKGGVDKRGP